MLENVQNTFHKNTLVMINYDDDDDDDYIVLAESIKVPSN